MGYESLGFASVQTVLHTRTVTSTISTSKMAFKQTIEVRIVTNRHAVVPFSITCKETRMSEISIRALFSNRHTSIYDRTARS